MVGWGIREGRLRDGNMGDQGWEDRREMGIGETVEWGGMIKRGKRGQCV
jgi:hypothetical protein